MPVSITGDGVYVGDGKGGLKKIEPTITRVEITVPGLEHIIIQDQKGIIFGIDPETGLPSVNAESMTVASEHKRKPNFFERFFRGKEG